MYINDIPNCSEFDTTLFADDTVSKPAFVYCVFSTIFGFEPSPAVLYDRDPDFIIQSVVGLCLD